MGMDVYGKNQESEKGSYFRNNVWWWRPLWNYCEELHGDITRKVDSGYSNDGDGLDADAIILGRTHGDCNACHGHGKVQHFATNYPFAVDNVREFAEFLIECDGFEIC